MTFIPIIKYPRCNSFNLYKYGKGIHGYQKNINVKYVNGNLHLVHYVNSKHTIKLK